MDSDDSDNEITQKAKPVDHNSDDDKPEKESDIDSDAGSEKPSQNPKKSGGKINRFVSKVIVIFCL